ncbi:hypothetical protein niasHT_037128 [Heterodera trifolii]|uniref:pyruvate kinase n=1 Tax=Heterodera trifolii TaxID=157864 RepID=A0ABD2IJY6_9BILA
MTHVRKTGIICSIGPVCRSVDMLVQMIEGGMDVARMNFSDGDHEYLAGTIKNVREAGKLTKRIVPIALEMKVPENGTVLLAKGGSAENLEANDAADSENFDFAVKHGVDFIFAFFIQNANGIKAIRQLLGEAGKDIKIIAKIDDQEGMDNLDEIITESDGLIVACEKSVDQQMLVSKCTIAGKPVITATQMLGSMSKTGHHTEGDYDVAKNAVLDGVDCVLLSEDLANSAYTVDALITMHDICQGNEPGFRHPNYFEELLLNEYTPVSIAFAAPSVAIQCRASAIILLTTTGKSALECYRRRMPIPVLAITRYEQVARQLKLCRGVFPVYYPHMERDPEWKEDVNKRISYGIEVGKERGFIHNGDFVVLITGWQAGAGSTNTSRLVKVE